MSKFFKKKLEIIEDVAQKALGSIANMAPQKAGDTAQSLLDSEK